MLFYTYYTYEETYVAAHFTKGYLFLKVVGLMPKYSLLAGDTNQVPFFPYTR